ncbi:hypothetical protein PtrSN002B_003473 [Pyrenophora tritici-repentis]|uniref:Uncharacterized protein n=2 Tax=Pyrenophora tritici-repentis TaxID=45151 RepID=A0A2W1HWP8_9PLEO|nr:uncharacterized protein PTRG_09381 [Pyrenophora tritici-repentis Pt-1C-BFP]KAA8617533.1 hypothetical protein PtrV1_09040 [Pyrenophora tritici-repentis]EDU42432.1 predicted protein [Pyrenophora tritici-repentis Pt-1C-BFP]KAF7441974.1 hypothetical protein A1F99_138260 [Pyrenophora tritici-repentis]KAF7567983.1 hypothetical protein PtrM4_125960 [Pyrenophora tritici-repentis]KAG9376802.1 hypothetical protein A1F94_012402 [Pyrenophora tritici-repentis]
MKHSGLHTSQASSAKLKNPTSAATTVYQYAILLYLALSYILQDDAQHAQPNKKKPRDQCRTSSPHTSPQIPTPARTYQTASAHVKGTRQNERYSSWQASPKPSQTRSPDQARSRLHTPRRDDHPHGPVKAQVTNAGLAISRVQMSEAWTCMRAVSCMPIKPSNSNSEQDQGKRRVKKVRWGVVQTREFEPEAEADEATTSEHEHSSDRTNARPDNASDTEMRG